MTTVKRLLRDQRGIVLVISLLIIALLLGGGIGAIVSMQTDLKTSGNVRAGTQAFYYADAGINHARQKLSEPTEPNFASAFSASDGYEVVPTTNFYGGAYRVTREGSATNPDRIKVLSVATAPNNAKSQIEAWLKREDGRPPKAIETDKKLETDSNTKILGICGGGHANNDLKADGNPAVEMANGLTASKKVDLKGTACIGSPDCATNPWPDAYVLDTADEKKAYEGANSSAEAYILPSIDPADYAPLVAGMESAGSHYILNDNGTVTTGGSCDAKGYCSGETSVSVPAGWSFSGGKWKVTGSSAANGVFYSETTVEISGSPGSSTLPWQATIISRDEIKVSGSPHVQPYPTASLDLKNHLFVSGNDITIDGNMTANYAGGAILTKKKFEIGGNATINGFILALDNGEIKSNAQISYNCDFGCSGPGCPPPIITPVSWAQKF